MRLPDEPDIPAQINIVPMIDVIFAILTFFIMSTLFLTRSEGLPVNLPKAGSAQQQQQSSAPITVTVDAAGKISVNRKAVAIDVLPEQVRTFMGNNSEALVVINADERVNHGQVVAVMDRLRQVQGAKLAIATQKP
ncbi:biopolymer transporter ExbD [Tolypothrix sp. FACHB-123]|uniref:ExbD/TolR family protein n=1 Tax=Tolypothrix sp. FACHB-123 TaxID=2692868 RepID=UPI00168372DA|nr:biopolymer transporter ExbD [Tolypothrix sp. FACHB-123]MBD2354643.1 biopolymer transporter ExbD [Tolypothrix sp. FACHB-123]